MKSLYFNLPTILTLIRLILSPLILPFCLVYFLPLNNIYINLLLAFLFFLFALTDFLDGYLARKYKLVTTFGSSLDHIADKFLVSSTLISLLTTNKIYFFWVIIFLCRELFMMSLRQIALENKISIQVSIYGKIKTTFQSIMLFIIIINPYHNFSIYKSYLNILEFIIVFITLFLSIFSAVQYYRSFKIIYNK